MLILSPTFITQRSYKCDERRWTVSIYSRSIACEPFVSSWSLLCLLVSDNQIETMFRLSFNQVLSSADIKFCGVVLTILTLVFAWFTIAVDIFILSAMICSGHLKNSFSKSSSRRIGILHSMNSYVHLLGNTLLFLFISLRTLFTESSSDHETKLPLSQWHCRLLNYLICIFTAGIFGSCFCQSLFRFWRLTQPNQSRFRKFSFHLRLMIGHWLLILLLSVPLWFRSVSVSSENFCVNQMDDIWPLVYVSCTSLIIPIVSIIIVYAKIILFIKNHSRKPHQSTHVKRDVPVIRRILLLICVLLSTSSVVIILWFLATVHRNLHPLAYRLFSLLSVIGMLMYSITFLIAFPQVRRALRDGRRPSLKDSLRERAKTESFRRATQDEVTSLDKEFYFWTRNQQILCCFRQPWIWSPLFLLAKNICRLLLLMLCMSSIL